MSAAEKKYDESSIRVLKGLEPVYVRPDMYTRTESPCHIVQEVIDNAADEALAGYATRIDVQFHEDGSVSIKDNGRGIPVGMHPTEKVPAVTLTFTRLHAGGKFDKANGGAYAFSGGLHGVGVAVTTALSTKVNVKVRRDGKLYEVEYLDGGRQIGDVSELGGSDSTGTEVRVWPDTKYFHSPKVPVNEVERLLRSKAVMLNGVTVTLTANGTTKEWCYHGGMAEYLAELTSGHEAAIPIYVAERYVSQSEVDSSEAGAFAVGEGGSFAFSWYPEGGSCAESFVNLIPTPAGGTHDSGIKAGVFEAVKSFIDHHALLPKNVKLQQEDVAAKMGYILSAKVLDPQFQGQTKEKLNNRSAFRLIANMVRTDFEVWLNSNVEQGKVIADIAIKQAMARQKSAQAVEKKKSSGVVLLPGKLTDCESSTDNELFLVEGDSAGGSAKMGRNKEFQAILPLRGKVLNTFEEIAERLYANNEIHDIAVAIGVEPHTAEKSIQESLAGLRYSRIFIMTDADVDGSHIQVLLLTLFYRHFPNLLRDKRIYISLPPLYRIDVAPVKGKGIQRFYALDEKEMQQIMQRLDREGVKQEKIEVGRFKGLGEMNAEQLAETSMHPATRRALPVEYDETRAKEVLDMFTMLMAKKEASARREWLTIRGNAVEADI